MTERSSSSAAVALHPAGLALDRLAPYLARSLPRPPVGRLRAEVIAGGKSNLTYVVSDDDHEWIVRRPPLGEVLATAHDVGREFRVIAALQPTSVPVPTPYVFCADPEVIGAPFYVMSRVSGLAYRTSAELQVLGAGRTQLLLAQLVDRLADLHAVDPVGVGLADLGRPVGFLARQLRRWDGQWRSSRTSEVPAVELLHRQLVSSTPPDGIATIVHGDYRLDNVLADGEGTIRAVLDWEMSTLGDPLTDVALLISRNHDVTGSASLMFQVSTAPGFPSSRSMIERYAARTGRDVSRLGWYLALAQYKRAVIFEGIYRRALDRGDVTPDHERAHALVEPSAAAGLDAFTHPGLI